jgi:hypothetical protein
MRHVIVKPNSRQVELPSTELSRWTAGSGARRAGNLAWIAVALWGAATGGFAIAQVPEPSAVINREYAIKAAFLYNFSTYVEWPKNGPGEENTPFIIGVLQTDPFGDALEKVAQTKNIGGRPIVVRLVKSAKDIMDCNILFIPGSVVGDERSAALRAARKSAALVVGESDDFIEQGGDVQFYLEGNKVKFAFNAELTKREDLKISSKLLSLAKLVPTR